MTDRRGLNSLCSRGLWVASAVMLGAGWVTGLDNLARAGLLASAAAATVSVRGFVRSSQRLITTAYAAGQRAGPPTAPTARPTQLHPVPPGTRAPAGHRAAWTTGAVALVVALIVGGAVLLGDYRPPIPPAAGADEHDPQRPAHAPARPQSSAEPDRRETRHPRPPGRAGPRRHHADPRRTEDGSARHPRANPRRHSREAPRVPDRVRGAARPSPTPPGRRPRPPTETPAERCRVDVRDGSVSVSGCAGTDVRIDVPPPPRNGEGLPRDLVREPTPLPPLPTRSDPQQVDTQAGERLGGSAAAGLVGE